MKIGIFGDSYCERLPDPNKPSWFELLQTQFGHSVKCFGEGGSSILFSAKLIEKHYSEFDFIIWAVTNPPRISIEIDEPPYNLHFTNSSHHDPIKFRNLESKYKVKAANDYYNYLLVPDDFHLTAKSLVEYQKNNHDNLMLIPCFFDPLQTEFNLYNLCEWEAKYYFPNILGGMPEIYKKYGDLRRCHLTMKNNFILAELVSLNLKPGIFQTDYSNFVLPEEEDFDFYWKKF
jgi:hypothetical protein